MHVPATQSRAINLLDRADARTCRQSGRDARVCRASCGAGTGWQRGVGDWFLVVRRRDVGGIRQAAWMPALLVPLPGSARIGWWLA